MNLVVIHTLLARVVRLPCPRQCRAYVSGIELQYVLHQRGEAYERLRILALLLQLLHQDDRYRFIGEVAQRSHLNAYINQ